MRRESAGKVAEYAVYRCGRREFIFGERSAMGPRGSANVWHDSSAVAAHVCLQVQHRIQPEVDHEICFEI
jgi:hypothetical protein